MACSLVVLALTVAEERFPRLSNPTSDHVRFWLGVLGLGVAWGLLNLSWEDHGYEFYRALAGLALLGLLSCRWKQLE